MRVFLPILLCLIGLDTVAQTSYVPPTSVLLKKGHEMGASADYFITKDRVGYDGNTVKFEDGESFHRIQSDIFGFYAPTDQLQIGGGIRFRQNQSTLLNITNDELETETSTGVESTYVNLMYAFKPINQITYSVDGSYRYRPFSNQEEGSLILGDDGSDYRIAFGGTYASKTNNFLSAKIGLARPGQHLSNEVYWKFESAMAWKYVALIAGVDGITSLNNDPYDNEVDRPLFYTGSTFLYGSKNRELIAPYAGVNLALGKNWRVELKGSQAIGIQSTDSGTSLSFALVRRVEEKTNKAIDQKFKEYDFEGSITKVSPKKGYVIIDKGLADDVQKGMKIDFYEFDYVGGNILLARGVVIQVKADTSIVKISQLFNTKKELKEGIFARGKYR